MNKALLTIFFLLLAGAAFAGGRFIDGQWVTDEALTTGDFIFSGNVGINASPTTAKLVVQGAGGDTYTTLQVRKPSGTPAFTILNTGNVGVGTTVVDAKLVLQGDGDATYTSLKVRKVDGTTSLVIRDDGAVGIGSTNPSGALDVVGNEVRVWTGAGSDAQALASGELYVEGDLEVDGTIYNGGAAISSSGWTDGGTNVYVTTTTDNVGIGTSLPANKLHVKSPTGSTLTLRLDTDGGAGAADTWFIEMDKNDNRMRFYNTSLAGTPSLVVVPDVGIDAFSSTTDAINASTSDTTGGIGIANTAATGDATLTFDVTGSVGWGMGIDDSDSDKFKISKSANLETNTRLTIDANGNIGIGTFTTGSLFVVPGLKATSGSRTLCIDDSGNVTSVAGACPAGT